MSGLTNEDYDNLTKVAAFHIVKVLRGLKSGNSQLDAQLIHVTQQRVNRIMEGEHLVFDAIDGDVKEVPEPEMDDTTE